MLLSRPRRAVSGAGAPGAVSLTVVLRWLGSVLLVVALLAPTVSEAQPAPMYETPNGPLSGDALANQLQAVGYPGPWDPQSILAAYARASGGPVTLIAGGSAPATIVVEIGGIGTETNPGGPWITIESLLAGFGFRRYQYSTCADISSNVQQLVSYVQTLRPNKVVLLGHSMGGVLALTAVGTNDLSGVVHGVVIADAPVNGLSSDLVNFGESVGAVPSPCQALTEMEDAAWRAASSASAARAMSNGVRVLDITNAYDNIVPLQAQQLPQSVNLQFDVSTGVLNHTAIFDSTPALTAISQFIRTL
jgi:pimeloyl-ACP methyl ester carboxylesterase